MGLFGKSFDDKVKDAVAQVRTAVPGLRSLEARVDGKTVTLTGEAASADAKSQAMQRFNALVETDNTFNQIRLPAAPPAPAAPAEKVMPAAGPAEMPPATRAPVAAEAPAAAAGAPRIHEVMKGDTLSALAKKYYGNASRYMTIFEANKDQLTSPDVIKVGQKLRIPE